MQKAPATRRKAQQRGKLLVGNYGNGSTTGRICVRPGGHMRGLQRGQALAQGLPGEIGRGAVSGEFSPSLAIDDEQISSIHRTKSGKDRLTSRSAAGGAGTCTCV